jgi:hypothetical protein
MHYTTAYNPSFLSSDHSSIGLTLTTHGFGDIYYVVQAFDFDPFAVEVFISALHSNFGQVGAYCDTSECQT